MKVVFEKPVLLESFVGTSKAGREYGRIRFATQDFDVYEIFCSADSARTISSYEPKTTLNSLSFNLTPDRSSGVRLVPNF